jgi:hypothetical protein
MGFAPGAKAKHLLYLFFVLLWPFPFNRLGIQAICCELCKQHWQPPGLPAVGIPPAISYLFWRQGAGIVVDMAFFFMATKWAQYKNNSNRQLVGTAGQI